MAQPTAWTPYSQAPFLDTSFMAYFDPVAFQGNYVQGTGGAANVNAYAWSPSLLMPVALTSTNVGGKQSLDVNITNASVTGTFTENTAHAEDAPHVSGDIGSFSLGVRNDADAILTSADGDYSPMAVDDRGRTKVVGLLGVKGTDGATIASTANPVPTAAMVSTVGGRAYVTTAGAALPLAPTTSRYQRLRTTDEPTTLLYDPFDSAALDTTNTWNTPVTSGGAAISKVTGGLQMLPGTTASAYCYMTSRANFNATVPGFLEVGHALKFLASPPTGVLRFWGRGTVANAGVPTISNPITDGEGWEIGSDAKLRAVVYASGVKTIVADLSASQATDGLYRRYNTQTRTDLGVWYLNSQDVPVCDSSFKFPDTQTLPLLFLAVNDPTTPPGVSSQVVCTGVIAADTGHNSTQISDGTYPWRKQTITAGGAAKSDLNFFQRYTIQDEDALGLVKYYGWEISDTQWIIHRRDTSAAVTTDRYANQSSAGAPASYKTVTTGAWDTRAALAFTRYDSLTGV